MIPKLTIKNGSDRDVSRRLREASVDVLDAGSDGLDDAGEWLLQEALELAPIDTGELVESGEWERSGTFGGHVAFYADHSLDVHEDLDAFHPDGQAKFLEEPAQVGRRVLLALTAAAIRRR